MGSAAGEEEPEGRGISVVGSLSAVVGEVSGLPDGRGPLQRECCDLARRVKLMSPLFDELRDCTGDGFVGENEIRALSELLDALVAARELLRSVNDASKLHQAFQVDKYLNNFQEVTEKIERALSKLSFDKLDISEEVREQVVSASGMQLNHQNCKLSLVMTLRTLTLIELVHAQFQRAKERKDLPDSQLLMDLSLVRSQNSSDPSILKRLSDKLQLRTINDLKRESVALHEMVISSGGDPEDCLEEMSSLLKKLKETVVIENPIIENLENKASLVKNRSPVIPDDFRCPISLELMKDPVIISTGQTYERSCIQKWLDAGHKTCPKTQQNLSHTALTPNFVLKSLIAQWCEANGIEPPKKHGNCRDKKASNSSDCDQVGINSLLQKLQSRVQEEQRAAAGELRLLAKRNADNRVCIAEAGAIPLLVELLSSPDPRTQEHAVTALLNLSINESNKNIIVNSHAIPKIVEVLKTGSMEARENAAATLFSLSVIDANKITIGVAGAIPALIDLLCQGSPRGKKDAATAIFNLAIYQGNKVRAVRAGIVVHLMRLLTDPSGGMMDESLAILAILASHQEGRSAIAEENPIRILVEVMKTGSQRNRENAAAVLFSLCSGDAQQVRAAREAGAEEALKELSESGTDRAKRKAGSLLELIHKDLEV
ncbi:U-box domain-containing protein 12 [Apostasia shenzhenica]|uniref:RING-type E3 ubiquitin transferase n=1 Tax=Apostasia shenzhenica TaxID=1088818 RepID=A0A2I0BCA5_9ASPA|nr:U-box domain-containing protein 12 [Apostasia shenzhenica]